MLPQISSLLNSLLVMLASSEKFTIRKKMSARLEISFYKSKLEALISHRILRNNKINPLLNSSKKRNQKSHKLIPADKKYLQLLS